MADGLSQREWPRKSLLRIAGSGDSLTASFLSSHLPRTAASPRSPIFIYIQAPLFFPRIEILCFYFTWVFQWILKKRMAYQHKTDICVTKNYTFLSHITAGKWYTEFKFSTGTFLETLYQKTFLTKKFNILF